MKRERDYSLKHMNTLNLECVAREFIRVEHTSEIEQIEQKDMVILGGGSNVILPSYYDGIILQPDIKTFSTKQIDKALHLAVGAGIVWHQVVQKSVELGYSCLANLALIPGSAGASVVQNIGAYGVEISSFIHSVETWDTQYKVWVNLDCQQCCFGYRDSLFKNQPNRYIITKINLTLSDQTGLKYQHQDLREYLKPITQPQARDIFDAVCHIRCQKLPNYHITPNAGSFFKNILLSEIQTQQLITKLPNIIHYKTDNGYKIATASLLEQLDYKGFINKEGVGFYHKHALILVNTQQATSEQLCSFAQQVIEDVYAKTQILLEIEPVYLGSKLA